MSAAIMHPKAIGASISTTGRKISVSYRQQYVIMGMALRTSIDRRSIITDLGLGEFVDEEGEESVDGARGPKRTDLVPSGHAVQAVC